jgi:hypothetical protein
MIKNKGIIIENLKKKDLSDFYLFVKNFFNFKILINNKYYKSSVFNSVFMKYQFWNKYKSNYNFKIIRDNKKNIILIHGYIPISKYDKQLDNKTICLSLCIGSDKVNFPLFPISYSAITNMDKVNFVYFINPSFLPFMRYKNLRFIK